MNLIERLRGAASKGISAWGDLQVEAADEIERLTAELEATKKAVQQNYFRVVEVTAERDALRAALHSISLASQNSGSTKEDMGLYARAAIAGAGK